MSAGKRPSEPGGDDDMVCGLDVCDELDDSATIVKEPTRTKLRE